MAQTPEIWGLRCPEGTGQDQRRNLTGPRLRRIAGIQEQCLRQLLTVCPLPVFSYRFWLCSVNSRCIATLPVPWGV
jgi:hypothetical protein